MGTTVSEDAWDARASERERDRVESGCERRRRSIDVRSLDGSIEGVLVEVV